MTSFRFDTIVSDNETMHNKCSKGKFTEVYESKELLTEQLKSWEVGVFFVIFYNKTLGIH